MSSDTAKVAFLFPGQGAQTVGMGAAVCAKVPAARALFVRASSVLGYDLYKLCTEGPAADLDSTVHSQPALFVSSLAALEQLKQDAPELVQNCSATAGLSLGEYTALVFAGVMDFEAGLRVVQERGRAMQDAADATSSGMVSVLGMEREQVAKLCDEARSDEVLEIANLLCPGNIVCSGETAACERLFTLATAAGAILIGRRIDLQPRALRLNYVYIIQSIDRPDQFYTGACLDVPKRIAAHNAGQSPHTAKFKPWRLISYHYFSDPAVAAAFERYLKSGSGRAFASKRLR